MNKLVKEFADIVLDNFVVFAKSKNINIIDLTDEFKKTLVNATEIDNNKCNYVYKKGNNANQQCKVSVKNGNKYCCKHIKNVNEITEIITNDEEYKDTPFKINIDELTISEEEQSDIDENSFDDDLGSGSFCSNVSDYD